MNLRREAARAPECLVLLAADGAGGVVLVGTHDCAVRELLPL
jgi:hypothetical protein